MRETNPDTLRRTFLKTTAAAGVALGTGTTVAAQDEDDSDAGAGALETVVDISGELTPENLAIDADGALYFSITAGEIRRLAPEQTQEAGLALDDADLVGELPGETLGVEVVPDGTLYAAVQSGDETGVWRVPRGAMNPEDVEEGEGETEEEPMESEDEEVDPEEPDAADEDDADAEFSVSTSSHPDLGDVLVGPAGMTLYVFDEDEQGGDESACYDDCEDNWPPLVVEEEPTAGDDVTAELTTFEREDGATQVAANGWPLYYFADDEEAGDANGQGVGDSWWVLGADGEPVREGADEAANGESDDEEVETDEGEADDEQEADDGPGEATEAEPFAILGVEDEVVPNGIEYDRLRDRLLVTESFGGVVYEVPLDADDPETAASAWFEDDRLSTEMFGVNGLTIGPDDDVFLAVTDDEVDGEEAGRILRVPVEDDGTAGASETYAEGPEVHGADGIEMHPLDGDLYVASILQSAVVRVTPESAVETVASSEDGLVGTSDLTFGTIPGQCNDLFICNFAPEQPDESAILRWSS